MRRCWNKAGAGSSRFLLLTLYLDRHMKTVSLIILLMFLLQPLACFDHPCDSCMGNADTIDTSGTSSHSHHQDADGCDLTVCCAEYINLHSGIAVIYAPLVSVIIPRERYQKLPNVIRPIFVPPQSIS